MPKNLTHLSLVQELRSKDNDTGIIEGYAAVWGVIDSYNTRFQRGCFKKTLENRMQKIKVLWNHDIEQPIGKLLDIREDDHGLFIQAQLITEVEKAKEAFNLIKGGAIDCLSFGFRTIKDKAENGVLVITEVMLGEVSPVVFEASPASKITSVRAEDFTTTDEGKELRSRGYRLFSSLDETLADIWWGESSDPEKLPLIQTAILAFGEAYTSWSQEVLDMRSGGVRMDIHSGNELTTSFRNYCSNKETTLEEICQETSFTLSELKSLRAGKVIADPDRLKEFDADIFTAHNSIRSKAVETLCSELRGGLNTAEATRIQALLKRSLHAEADSGSLIAYMDEFRKTLTEVK